MNPSPVLPSLLMNLLDGEKEACLAYAAEHGMGLEIRDVDWSRVADGGAGRSQAIARYRRLPTIPGLVTLHSPDRELSPGDVDPRIAAAAREWVSVFARGRASCIGPGSGAGGH